MHDHDWNDEGTCRVCGVDAFDMPAEPEYSVALRHRARGDWPAPQLDERATLADRTKRLERMHDELIRATAVAVDALPAGVDQATIVVVAANAAVGSVALGLSYMSAADRHAAVLYLRDRCGWVGMTGRGAGR
jgi:hypothetical protein